MAEVKEPTGFAKKLMAPLDLLEEVGGLFANAILETSTFAVGVKARLNL